MSARNWTVCPQCRQKRQDAIDAVKSQYGKLSREVYEDALTRAEKALKEIGSNNQSVREDYEIGVDGTGQFFVDYGASCENCDFEVSFSHNMD